MLKRPRILRKSEAIRSMLREVVLSPSDFIAPLFVVEGKNTTEAIPSLSGYFRRSVDETIKEVQELHAFGIQSVLVFVKCEDHLKDNKGTEALNSEGLMQRAIYAIKQAVPEMCVMSDVALDPYSSYGHDGLVSSEGEIENDETVHILAEMAVSHAKAGVDFIAPSDMMDGRIREIRLALEKERLHRAGIMSYCAKYASCLYGPFRDALDSAPNFGDKKTYQMDFCNRGEVLREAKLDEQEGADILMVKPSTLYLDVIQAIASESNLPVAAYHVSGEYAMIKASAEKGWVDEQEAMFESLCAVKRAGASLIATYFAKEMAHYLQA